MGVIPIPKPEVSDSEPVHPICGTLDELLARMAQDIRTGHEVWVTRLRALSWFAQVYRKRRQREKEE